MRIVTNNIPRPLTVNDNGEFTFKYKGELYKLSEFMLSPINGWRYYLPFTHFCGMVVHYNGIADNIIVGLYCDN
jgi:hypothetical protein